ncbi:MAG TPA: flagellar biosynthesis protein FlhF [Firmicutes bacterium]|nr:flagellar biosynthesis protein FlhF [Bacillota bacterium]
MRVKRFVADTAQQAIARVKRELGDDALILHSRPIKEGGFLGLFATKRYEVLAAVDNSKETVKMPAATSKRPMAKVEEKAPELPKVEQAPILPELEKVKKELSEIRMAIEGVSEQVKVTPKPAGQVPKPETKPALESALKSESLKELQEVLIQTYPIRLSNKPTLVALVGPTGVGKTTTIAKLAANFALFEGKSVGLVTIDTYRIAAVEQLKTYSEIINLPIEVVYTAADFKRALHKLANKQLILIDTAGRSQKNKQQIRELKHFFNGRRLDETHLVISANTKLEDLLETAESFNELEINRLIFTKLDETNSLSNLIELAGKIRIPLSYVTTGQSVPEDIEVATFDVIKRYAGKENINA